MWDEDKNLSLEHSIKPVDYYILLSLADGDRHGYNIIKRVLELSCNTVKIPPGSLYRALKRLLDEKLIEESDVRPDQKLDDARRRYYRLTELGKKVGSYETRRMEIVMESALILFPC
ncbi:MAG: helix-turn-helix transcriptional regulator [Symploca sp. SIO1B1]|nr:helix-turn-helix transcriptional regulator [Symploca sp. SIO1B1]